MNAETAHDFHRIEFKEMCNQMIQDALRDYSEQIQLDVHTTLNGASCSMSGLVSDLKRQITNALRKAFK